ncbi:MAG: 1-deoxy-D-xylulose-5-phosphate synthase [Eubacteriales bacterium]|nr:1-deoxy-D-xylulose-5-phosphate synthase [Eubacteriales bacterium]
MGKLLDHIQKANDIKKIPESQYKALAKEIRQFLLENVSKTGGHLASNLGTVELTMALHLCMDFPKDQLVFDVGHQSYTHKILTGRKDQFHTLRQEDGICGFPKRKESPCDAFGAGHSSTSIAAAAGLALARNYRGGDETVVALIGDGALSGGMAFEALNNLSIFRKKKKNFIIILNDNEMSIAKNVGGMSRYLGAIRSKKSYGDFKNNVETHLNQIPVVGQSVTNTLRKSKNSIKNLLIPGMLFENMGITYYGPVDGHNIPDLLQAIEIAKKHSGPILIHAVTKKGKGYGPAMKNPEKFHGIGSFDLETGNTPSAGKESYTDVFSKHLVELAVTYDELVAITAAMPSGTGLNRFKAEFPDRFYDVGIAEEYAVTCAAGMAANGLRPVVAVYSTFLQRAYDQIIHDVCMQKLPVIFCLDRSGFVGADGETHQGTFDISYLSHVPNLTIMAPKNGWELKAMMDYAMIHDGAIALKYPRGVAFQGLPDATEPITFGKSEVIAEGEKIVILSVGNMMEEALKTVDLLKEEGIHPGLVNVRFIKPMDKELMASLAEKYDYIITMEENMKTGGFGSMVSTFLHENDFSNKLLSFAIPDCFVEHASVETQRRWNGIDAETMAEKILERIK